MASGIKDKVAIVGMGCSKFGERWDCGPEELMLEAFDEAIKDAPVGRNQIEKEKVSRGTSTQEISRWKHVEDPSFESRSRRHTYDEKHERIFREHRI